MIKNLIIFFWMAILFILPSCQRQQPLAEQAARTNIVGFDSTEVGIVGFNKNGEYLITDWELYYRLFEYAVRKNDRTMLKKLCYESPMVITEQISSTEGEDYVKSVIDKIDLSILMRLFEEPPYLKEYTEKQTFYKLMHYPDSPSQRGYSYLFKMQIGWGGWEWEALSLIDTVD